MRLHHSPFSALEHSSTWAALSGLFAVSASELWPPYQHMAVLGGIICGVIGIILRSPDMDKDDLREQSDADNSHP